MPRQGEEGHIDPHRPPPQCNPTDNVHVSPNGSIITIVGARPSNHGAYRCVASNAYGVAQSVVNLNVYGEGTWTRVALPFCPQPRFLAQDRQVEVLPQHSLPVKPSPSWSLSFCVRVERRLVPTQPFLTWGL